MRRSESCKWLPVSAPRPIRKGVCATRTYRRAPSGETTSSTAPPSVIEAVSGMIVRDGIVACRPAKRRWRLPRGYVKCLPCLDLFPSCYKYFLRNYQLELTPGHAGSTPGSAPGSPRSLFVTQSFHGVEFGSAQRWKVAGGQSDSGKADRRNDKRGGIVRFQSEQQGSRRSRHKQ